MKFISQYSPSALCLCLVLCFSGCLSRSPAPTLYVFEAGDGWDTMAGRSFTGKEPAVSLAPIKLPEYLDRPQLVVRTGENTIRAVEQHRWGIELQRGILDVLSTGLSRELPEVYVNPEPLRLGTGGYHIQISILRLDGALNGPVHLAAQWNVRKGGARGELLLRRLGTYENQPAQASYAAYVESVNQLIRDLGRDIADDIRQNLSPADEG